MTRSTAEKVVRSLLSAVGEVNDSLLLIQPEVSEEMYREYKRQCAEVMAAIYLDLVKPIVRDYPDLDPSASGPSAA